MIVRCTTKSTDVLPTFAYNSKLGVTAKTEFAVTPGRIYLVFGVTMLLGIAWYYVLDDDGHDWPTWVPAPLFDIVDGTIPASWIVGYFRFSRDEQYPLISFPEWATDHSFYERLVEGDSEAIRVFATRRAEAEKGHA
jgi:hypothetical protein